MANEEEKDERKNSGSASPSEGGESRTGDPGRTPGTAEGDEETVEEDLRQKEGQQQ
ncbi:MAG TPA: hypothetical protein VF553_11955 [Pyrinomonadaceae bacterium]